MPVKNPDEPFTRITVQEAKEILDRGEAQFVDVRETNEYVEGHAAGTTLIPLGKVFERSGELADDKDILFICRSGARSAVAAEYAAAAGKTRLYNVEGGTLEWAKAGLPIEK